MRTRCCAVCAPAAEQTASVSGFARTPAQMTSHDAAHLLRSREAIKARGQWRADSSVTRYEKSARLAEVLTRWSDKMLNYGEESAAAIEDLLLQRCAAFLPKRSSQGLPGRKSQLKLEAVPVGSRKHCGAMAGV